MKATCKHPIEWDKRLFNCEKIEKDYREITNAVLNESIKNKLIKESEKSDIWEKGLSKLFKKNNFYFVNPIYFLNHLENAGLLEFNPYEKNTDNLQTCVEPITYCSGKDNPGFAPISYKKTNYKYNGIYYARITGHFNDWYGSYYHEGVDFEGSVGTPIHSFICGKVVMMKNQGTKHYGLSVLIQKNEKEDGKNVYYLLGHLSEYAPQLTINSQVYPGMVVGKVGNTGNCRTNGHALTPQERNKGLGSHLHLSLYKTKLTFDDLYDKTNENFKTIQCGLVNPFLHVEIRNVDK